MTDAAPPNDSLPAFDTTLLSAGGEGAAGSIQPQKSEAVLRCVGRAIFPVLGLRYVLFDGTICAKVVDGLPIDRHRSRSGPISRLFNIGRCASCAGLGTPKCEYDTPRCRRCREAGRCCIFGDLLFDSNVKAEEWGSVLMGVGKGESIQITVPDPRDQPLRTPATRSVPSRLLTTNRAGQLDTKQQDPTMVFHHWEAPYKDSTHTVAANDPELSTLASQINEPCAVTDSAYASAPPIKPSAFFSEPRTRLSNGWEGGDDDRTWYTADSSVDASWRLRYVQELASDLCERLQLWDMRKEWESASVHAPALFKEFAVKVGSFGTPVSRNIMQFVFQRSSKIVEAVSIQLAPHAHDMENHHGKKPFCEDEAGVMTLQEKMSLWADKSDTTQSEIDSDDVFKGVREADEDEITASGVMNYRDLVVGSPHHQWLITKLSKELGRANDTLVDQRLEQWSVQIRDHILNMLPYGKINLRCKPRTYDVIYKVPLAPDIRQELLVAIEGAHGAAATRHEIGSILHHLRSSWSPNSDYLLYVLEHLHHAPMTQPNGDHLSAWIEDETLSLRCRSYPYSISEWGQMLAWFGTAVFRLSDEDSGEGYLPVFKKRAVGGPWRGAPDWVFCLFFRPTPLEPNQPPWYPPVTDEIPRPGEIERYLGLQPRFSSEGNSFGLTEDDSQATEGQPSGSKGPVYTADGSFDSDMLSLSDRSDRIDPFNWSSQEESIVLSDVLHCLLAEWKWSRIDTREAEKLSEGIKQFQPTSVQDGQESSAPQTQTQSSSIAKSSTVPSSGHKRPLRAADNADQNDEDDEDSVSRPRKKARGLAPGRKLFACPFWKKHPRAYRDCFSYKLSRIKDVKHLARQHTPIHCERCLRVFPDRHSKSMHLESDEPCTRGLHGDLDGINNEQREDLQKKSKRGQTEDEQWYVVWNILFANTPRPDSPYMDFEQSRDFAEWVEFCQRRGAEVVAEEVSRHLWSVFATAESIAELVQIAQSGFRRVFEEFQAGMGALPPPNPPSDPPSELSAGEWLDVSVIRGESHGSGQGQADTADPVQQSHLAMDHTMNAVNVNGEYGMDEILREDGSNFDLLEEEFFE